MAVMAKTVPAPGCEGSGKEHPSERVDGDARLTATGGGTSEA